MRAVVVKYIGYHGLDTSDNYYFSRPRGLDEYVLVLTHTPLWFCTASDRYLLKKHQMFIYDKGVPQLFYGAGEDVVHDWLHFDMTDAEREVFCSRGIPFNCPFAPANPFVLSEYIRMMSIEYYQSTPHSADIQSALLDCMLAKLSDMLAAPPSAQTQHRHYGVMAEIKYQLDSFPGRDWSLAAAAMQAGMSATWFEHTWREIFGTTFQSCLIDSRIAHAKRLLSSGGDKVSYVAQQCGFRSDVHFMRQFRERTGFTPTEYRKNAEQSHRSVRVE